MIVFVIVVMVVTVVISVAIVVIIDNVDDVVISIVIVVIFVAVPFLKTNMLLGFFLMTTSTITSTMIEITSIMWTLTTRR